MRRKLQKDNKKVQKVPHQSNDLKNLGVKFQDMSQHLLMKKNFKIVSKPSVYIHFVKIILLVEIFIEFWSIHFMMD